MYKNTSQLTEISFGELGSLEEIAHSVDRPNLTFEQVDMAQEESMPCKITYAEKAQNTPVHLLNSFFSKSSDANAGRREITETQQRKVSERSGKNR